MIPAAQEPTEAPETGSLPTISGGDRIASGSQSEEPKSHEQAPEVSIKAPLAANDAPEIKLPPPVVTSHRLDLDPTTSASRSTVGGHPVPPALPTAADAPTMIVPRKPAVPPPPPKMPPPLPQAALPISADAGRKRLVGDAPRQAQGPQQYRMPSTITPSEPVRKRLNARSKAARSSVVVVFDGLVSLATILSFLVWLAFYAALQGYEKPGPLSAEAVVIIPPKKSRDEIGEILEANGVVSSGTVFVYGSMVAEGSELKAGEYEFHPHQTMREVADELAQNKVVQHKITFPEGWTSEQIVQRLVDDPVLTGKVVAIPEEGSLLPDTYIFPRGETRQQILDLMHKNLDRRLTDIWAHRNADMLRQLKVPKDLVILASIIEKETSKPDERPRIAAVFVNRLERNMRLETDPTILYGLYGGKAWTESRTITKADLLAPNPYNTYKINGLPPGPIGNPGRASLEAAANPMTTNELYFVADGTGGHAFAETLDEHNKNVARWREIERQRKLGETGAPPVTGAGTGLLTTVPSPTPPTPPVAAKPAVSQTTSQQRPRPRVTVPAPVVTPDQN